MPNTFPTNFPDWALSPPAQGSLNEQQTISFIGTPVSGSYQLNLGTAVSPAIPWNASAATVQTAINDIYAAATATVTGGAAPTSFVADFGTNSQTNLIAQMTVSNNTMLTVGGAQVTVQVNISQASQLPALVNVDTAHQNDGWSLFEFPPFNIFNQWMALVGQAIRLLFPQGIPAWVSTLTYPQNSFVSQNGVIYVSLINANLGNSPASSPADWQAYSNGVPTFWGGTDSGGVNQITLTIPNYPITGNVGPALVTGTGIYIVPANTNNSSVVISVNSNSNLNIRNKAGGQFTGGELVAGSTYLIVYNGSHYTLIA